MARRPTISETIRTALEEAMDGGISQEELGRQLDVAPSVLSRFRHGETQILSGLVDKLAAHLGLELTKCGGAGEGRWRGL